MENNLEIIPVINKIDLPTADVERVMEEIDTELGLDPDTHLNVRPKRGSGSRRSWRPSSRASLLPRAIPEAPWPP